MSEQNPSFLQHQSLTNRAATVDAMGRAVQAHVCVITTVLRSSATAQRGVAAPWANLGGMRGGGLGVQRRRLGRIQQGQHVGGVGGRGQRPRHTV